MLTGLYRSGDSPVHGISAGAKLAVLLAAGIAVFLVRDPVVLAVLVAAALGLTWPARIPPAALAGAAAPFLVLIALFLAVHALATDLTTGLVVAARFAIMVVLGLLVAMTTRLSDLVAAVERGAAPLARLGVDPEKVGLVLSLTIRFVPLVATTYLEIAAAQKARGLERSVAATMIPLIVRLLQRAEDIADALAARGAGD